MPDYHSNADDVYRNAGNRALVAMVPRSSTRVLDVGCGAGDNARLLVLSNPGVSITGITLSQREADAAADVMQSVFVADLETDPFSFLAIESFDLIVCSHVLEHLRDATATLRRLVVYLRPGGSLLIALPNVVEWRNRALMLAGRFDYTNGGLMDTTHLRFFTWHTAEQFVREALPEFHLVEKRADGGVPLWWARKLMPSKLATSIDRAGCGLLPNLFAWQVLLLARKPLRNV